MASRLPLDEAWAEALRQQRCEALRQQTNLAAWEIWDAAEPARVEAERAEEAARAEAERAEEARLQAARAYHIHQEHARLAARGRQARVEARAAKKSRKRQGQQELTRSKSMQGWLQGVSKQRQMHDMQQHG